MISQLIQSLSFGLGMASSPEMNNKMNNKVDGSGTPKPESKSKVACQLCVVKTITLIVGTQQGSCISCFSAQF